jgi:superfamily II DNA or RNA helicase
MTENLEKGTVVVGLTATPGRGIDVIQNKLLAEVFAHRKFGITIDNQNNKRYSYDENEYNVIDYLIMEDIMPRIEAEALYTYSEFLLSKNDRKSLSTLIRGDYPEYSSEFLKKLSEDNRRNIPIVERLIELTEDKKQVLYFGTSRDQSLLIYAVLTKMGVKAMHVDARTNKQFRKAIVQKFREGDINIICNFNIFTTGFDAPNIDVIFIGRPVNSPVLYNQMVGRGMRGVKMGGKENLKLIQVMDKISSDDFEFNPYRNYGYFTPYWKQDN